MGEGTTRARTAEPRLRELIERLQREHQPSPWSDDVYFVSGAVPQPIKGLAAFRAAQAEVRLVRRNQSATVTSEHLSVAEAGDPAYEHGTYHQEWDTPDGEHCTVDGAYLRVWRQRAGEWRVEAMMMHYFA
jgi:ketosteroid isomerase-like protein